MNVSFYNKALVVLLGLGIICLGCNSSVSQNSSKTEVATVTEDFKNYWYQGKAEISSYDLKQARYGQIRNGHQVILFVTEDFSKTKHQKVNKPNNPNAVKVIKMNRTKNFNTGIYPYSLLNSVFTPVELPKNENTLRSTTSSQEWCGHSFTLIDLREKEYDVQLHSYFISEGDTLLKLQKAFLEDALYNRIRINPSSLPEGEIEIIPGSFFQRFKHIPFKIEKAKAELISEQNLKMYRVEYLELSRVLEIKFQKDFPYRIEKVIESYDDGGKLLKSTANRKSTVLTDYWNKNSLEDSVWREKLHLD